MNRFSRMIRNIFSRFIVFKGSEDYWIKRYKMGGHSGRGSYDAFAEFKSEVINEFVEKQKPQSVLEFGCGDGNLLKYLVLPEYVGFDVSPVAIKKCKKLFSHDEKKSFKLMKEYSDQTAELSMSLDVIFHLVEDEVFEQYMRLLFNSSRKYVIVYSTNSGDLNKVNAPHVKHRNFTDWVEKHIDEFSLIEKVENTLPKGLGSQSSATHFYFYQKSS